MDIILKTALTTWDNISFGVQDEQNLSHCYISFTEQEISPDHACCHRITFPCGEEFDKKSNLLHLENKHLF